MPSSILKAGNGFELSKNKQNKNIILDKFLKKCKFNSNIISNKRKSFVPEALNRRRLSKVPDGKSSISRNKNNGSKQGLIPNGRNSSHSNKYHTASGHGFNHSEISKNPDLPDENAEIKLKPIEKF